MSLPVIVAAAAYGLISIALGFRGWSITDAMITEVNLQLPKDQRFTPLGWHFFKSERLFNEYRRLYPHGPRIRQFRIIQATLFASLVICVSVFMLSKR